MNNAIQTSVEFYGFSFVLKSDYNVYAFGSNEYEQLGYSKNEDKKFEPLLENIIQISAGSIFFSFTS